MTVAVWVGHAAPARSIRWLDGAIAAAAKFGTTTTVLAAGDPTWLDLAADRANRAGLPSAGIATDLALDYLGWGQVVAAMARHLGATTILVDEASHPGRWIEVAAIAEQLGIAQLTHVVAIAPDGAIVHASRVAGRELLTVRIRGDAAIGLRIAGPQIEEYPTPTPSGSMRRLDLPSLGLDPKVLARRASPPRTAHEPRRTAERVAAHLAVHLATRSPSRRGS